MSATNGFVLTVDHSVPPKVAIDGEYRHAWKAPASSGGDPVIASGINVVVPGTATADNAFQLADLVGLVGPNDVLAILLAHGATNSSGIALWLQGFAGDNNGLYVYLDSAHGSPGLWAVNLDGNDHRINWAVERKTLPTPP